MATPSPIKQHQIDTRKLAKGLNQADIYHWLVEFGYFPESYVLPPCFRVVKLRFRNGSLGNPSYTSSHGINDH